ncbi:unnamed protein product [Peronospora belbahrii]|uniref:Uncharacterized protein n=1 Tax=Peronospora belbahrii TaxID=622444 RepID=A0AAU9KQI3_9STRA|nr:unnamed protein product [Peronospora belbahrii]
MVIKVQKLHHGPFDPDSMSFSPLPVHLNSYAVSSTLFRLPHQKNSSSFRQLMSAAVYARSGVRLVLSQDMQPLFLQQNGFKEPVLIADNNYQVAGLHEPFPVLDAVFVAEILTANRLVRSTDVATQTKMQLTASMWQAKAFDNQPDEKKDTTLLANAEFQFQQTSTQLQVAPPVAVAHLNWHCLIFGNADDETSTSNADLDFTLAPGGQCTWLSVSGGALWVFLIPPTLVNWNIYRAWKNDSKCATMFVAECVDKCIKCVVSAGSTLLVPAGRMFARFAGGVQSCSLFHGYFACTSAMETQLGIVLLEMQHNVLAQYWNETTSGWLRVDPNVQLWTAVSYYMRQLLMVENGINVQISDQDCRALRRALPHLHEWSALPASLKSVNDNAWTPSSQQEAQAIVSRMAQALVAVNLPAHKTDELEPTAALKGDTKLPRISPNEATYIYSAASVPNSISESVLESTTLNSSNTSIYSLSALTRSMWADYGPMRSLDDLKSKPAVCSQQRSELSATITQPERV